MYSLVNNNRFLNLVPLKKIEYVPRGLWGWVGQSYVLTWYPLELRHEHKACHSVKQLCTFWESYFLLKRHWTTSKSLADNLNSFPQSSKDLHCPLNSTSVSHSAQGCNWRHHLQLWSCWMLCNPFGYKYSHSLAQWWSLPKWTIPSDP